MRFSEPTTEDDMVHGEMEQTIRDLVDMLPDEQQEVVRLRYYSKLSFQEIAETTDVSINTALGRMRYALINLRRMIKEKNIVLN
jgi:RNA polymerase sigma-70 factor (ECF subfamily)